MANYFSSAWDDITVAFPVNILEIDLINQLAQKVKLNLLVESETIVKLLDEQLKFPVNLFIKIDAGYHRTGVSFDNKDLINRILHQIDASSSDKIALLNMSKKLFHPKLSYHLRDRMSKCVCISS